MTPKKICLPDGTTQRYPREAKVEPSCSSLPSSLRRLAPQCGVVLSILAHSGSQSDAGIRTAFERGASHLRGIELALLPRDGCGLADLDSALQRLVQADGSCVQQLLVACAACIAADRTVTQAEGELLRAIADALGCPMPPLLPGQALA